MADNNLFGCLRMLNLPLLCASACWIRFLQLRLLLIVEISIRLRGDVQLQLVCTGVLLAYWHDLDIMQSDNARKCRDSAYEVTNRMERAGQLQLDRLLSVEILGHIIPGLKELFFKARTESSLRNIHKQV